MMTIEGYGGRQRERESLGLGTVAQEWNRVT